MNLVVPNERAARIRARGRRLVKSRKVHILANARVVAVVERAATSFVILDGEHAECLAAHCPDFARFKTCGHVEAARGRCRTATHRGITLL